jgi:hypothetical protein
MNVAECDVLKGNLWDLEVLKQSISKRQTTGSGPTEGEVYVKMMENCFPSLLIGMREGGR